jgi:DNA-binding transcriptional LysR family regulator
MRRDRLAGVTAFVAVARAGGFTPAAARLGVSVSAVSHAVRDLEQRLGIRLLNRSTRSVGLTEAGQRYLARVRPALEELEAAEEGLSELRDEARGLLRIDISRPAYLSVLAPRLARFREAHPGIELELVVADTLSDIVADGCDAGIRLGESLEQDMIAIPVSGELHTVIAASPAYFARHPPPADPAGLAGHDCIGFRLPSGGTLYRWELERDGRELEVVPKMSITVNDALVALDLALAGAGIGYFINDIVDTHLASGRLVRVLEDWSPRFPGYFLYHSARRNPPAKLRALIDALRV